MCTPRCWRTIAYPNVIVVMARFRAGSNIPGVWFTLLWTTAVAQYGRVTHSLGVCRNANCIVTRASATIWMGHPICLDAAGRFGPRFAPTTTAVRSMLFRRISHLFASCVSPYATLGGQSPPRSWSWLRPSCLRLHGRGGVVCVVATGLVSRYWLLYTYPHSGCCTYLANR